MEKKNTILLTVIAVATLLVAVVGATFAYFTATASTTGDQSSTGKINTAEVGSVGINQVELGKSTNSIYPGTKNYVGISLQATKQDTDADFTLTYNVTGKVELTTAFAHDVTWKLYKVDAAESTPVTCDEVTATPAATGTQYSQTCTVGTSLTSAVAEGTIAAGETSDDVEYTAQTIDTDGGTAYYYLVVEYPNKSEDQNADQGKDITATLNKATITNTAQKSE